MKKVLTVTSVVALAVMLVCASSVHAQVPPTVTYELLDPVSGEPLDLRTLELDVGETVTFEIQITSSEPFVVALAMTDQYYPGRSVFARGDHAARGTEATLYVTLTGKRSTVGLAGGCYWPETEYCWENGEAPISIVTGVRFKGGLTDAVRDTFNVVVH